MLGIAGASNPIWNTVDLQPGATGEPGCRTGKELLSMWPNHQLLDRYWTCEKLYHPAVEHRCRPGQFFMYSAQACVQLAQYQWTIPVQPPSRPL